MSHPINNLRFLELSIACDEVLPCMGLFQQLGFQSLPTNEIWDYPYAVMSDGRCFIGLHDKAHFEKISENSRFSFACEDISNAQRFLNDKSHYLAYSDLDSDDTAQNALFISPSGIGAHFIAARPFSPPSEKTDSTLGYFRGYLFPKSHEEESLSFWEDIGLLAMHDEDSKYIQLSTNNFNAVVSDFDQLKELALLFEHPEPESIFPHLARYGMGINMPENGLAMNGVFSITAPNGIELIVKKES